MVLAQFDKLKELLNVLSKDIPKLRLTLQNEPDKWGSRVGDMAFGFILAGFHNAEVGMTELRKVAIYELKDLKDILGEISELADMLE